MNTQSMPVIGFTLDHEEGGGYSRMPWYALRENYCSAISRFGAIPLPLPHEVELAEQYLDMIDGLVVTGGAFDVPPEMYGEVTKHEKVTTKDRRTKFEWAMVKGALARKLPILGICGGQQLLNVVLGGTLIQHIPDSVTDALEHEQKNPRTEPGHAVHVAEGTLLYRILSSPLEGERLSANPQDAARSVGGNKAGNNGITSHPSRVKNRHPDVDFSTIEPPPQGGRGRSVDDLSVMVNSAHHQAVAKPAPGVIVDAIAPDGVIEGIELPQEMHPFCLGLQWHPEYFVTEADEKIMAAFVGACGRIRDV